MKNSHFNWAGRSFGPAVKSIKAGAAVLLCAAAALTAQAGADNRAPEVPNNEIAVEAGNKVHFQALGIGVQIYTWNGSSWGSAVPEATLFHGEGVVAIHFAGPSWQSNSGSTVVGALPPLKHVIVDQTAIPWLLLKAASAEGSGIFADTTFIQRVNTVGGMAPSTNGTFVGQVARVPYSADYIFYRNAND